jgi:hypothetical protein
MSNVYEIGIKIGMQNAVSPVLALLAKEVLGLDNKVAGLIKRFAALNTQQKLALGGGVGLAAGVATLNVYGKIVDKGNELVAVQRRMLQAGVANKDMVEATQKAYEMTAKYRNTGIVENLKLINDARSTFGSQHDATGHIDDFIKAESFLKAYQGGKGASGAHGLGAEIIAAMKSGEIAGKITPEAMKEHVAQLVGMRVAYGNNVKITDYLTAQRAGGVALRNSEDSFRYGIFPALVQENGVNAGTMMMTAFNKIVAGTGNRTQSLRAMEGIGLLNDDNVDYDKNGRVVRLKNPSGIKGSEDAARNFPRWVMETLKPLLDVKTGGDHIKEAQLISQLFPDRNAAKAVTEIIQQWPKLVKDAALQMQARNEYTKNGSQEGSLDYQKQAFGAQLDSLAQTLGAPMVAQATATLKSITESISSMVNWAKDTNPEALKAIGSGIMIIGAGLTALGAAAVIGAMASFAGTVGVVVAGIAAFGAGIAVFWPQVSFAIGEASKALEATLSAARRIFDGVGEAVSGGLNAIISAIQSFIAAIKAIPGQIGGAIGSLMPWNNPAKLAPGVSPGEGGKVLRNLGLPSGDKRSALGNAFDQMAWNSPPRSQTLRSETTVVLDGQVVGRSVVSQIMRDNEHVTSAPHHDGMRGYVGPDAQFATA